MSSPSGEMVVSSTTSQLSSSPEVNVDEPEVEEEVVRFQPPCPPPAHSSSMIVTSHASVLDTNSSLSNAGYSLVQQPASHLSHASQQLPFRANQEDIHANVTSLSSRRFFEGHSSSSSPPTPDAADIDSTTTEQHGHHHVQYSSSMTSTSSRLLSSQSSAVPLPSYSDSQMQLLQSHMQSSYFESDLRQQHLSSQQHSYSNNNSGSSSSATAVQQLQQMLLQTSSSSSLPSDLTQGSSNSHVYTQSHHHDYGHTSESSQQQIIRLYHHLQESAASLASHASLEISNNSLSSQMENSSHVNNSLHQSWQSQHLLSSHQEHAHQVGPADLDLNDYEDDEDDNQGLDLVAPPAHMRSVIPANNNSNHHLHHHFLLPSMIPVSEGTSGVTSHSMRSLASHESQHPLIQEDLDEEAEAENIANQVEGIDVHGSSDEIIIPDLPVESRARASLPSAYLFIDIVMDISEEQDLSEGFNSLSSDPVIFGVFAHKTIPERTQFGPVEGVISNSKAHLFNQHQQNLIVFISDSLILDQSDENKSNWMRFVRSATSSSSQNLILVTKEQTQPNPDNVQELITTTKFYFMTTKTINPREELRVWYSKEYAERFRLKLLEDNNTDVIQSRQQHHSSRSSPTDLSMFRSTASAPPTIASNHHFFPNQAVVGQSSQLPSLSHRLSHQGSHSGINDLNAAAQALEQQSSHSSPFGVHNPHNSHLSTLSYLSSPSPHPHLHHVQQTDQQVYQSQPISTQTTLTTLDPVPIDFNLIPTTQSSSNHLADPSHQTAYLRHEEQYQPNMTPSLQQSNLEPKSPENDQQVSGLASGNGNASSSTSQLPVESPSASLIPATPPSASGGHKLRNKIAKTQQQQQLQLLKHRTLEGKGKETEGLLSKPTANNQPSSSNLMSSTTGSSYSHQHKCDVCGKSFNRFYSLRRHQIMHSGEKKFKCPVCNMSFSHVYNRNRHVKRHANRSNGMMRNKQLQQQSQAVAAAAAKDKSGNQENQQTSLVIDESPSDEVSLKTESSSATSCSTTTTGIILLSNNPNKPYKCSQCYKCFTTEDRLVKHALVHDGDDRHKPFQCSFCHKRFLNNSALSCHLKMHSTPKDQPRRYDCILCGNLFDSTQSRKEHLVSHRDPQSGRFPCSHCKKKFEEFAAVRKHIRAFHSNREYPCHICQKVFPRPDKLKLHMLKHSDHREFLCQTCGKQFKRKDKLKEHISRMHAPDREAKLAMKAAAKAAAVEAATAQLRAAVESASAVIATSNQPTSSNIPGKGKGKHSKNTDAAKQGRKFVPKVSPSDYHRFVYKCHSCQLGFKRRGMLVNHLAKRHPETPPDAVPELNLPILKTTRDYFCQYCDKVYKSSSKRKGHILKNHPGKSLPLSNRHKGGLPSIPGVPNPTYSAPVGAVPTNPHYCNWCFKQYASKAKLLQHQRKKHSDDPFNSANSGNNQLAKESQVDDKTIANEVEVCDQSQISVVTTQEEFVDHLSFVSTSTTSMPTNNAQNNNNSVTASNLMSILGSFAATETGSSVAADLQELLQTHSSAANDILTQAMAEFTNNGHQLHNLSKHEVTVTETPNHGIEHQTLTSSSIPSSEGNMISNENDLSFN